MSWYPTCESCLNLRSGRTNRFYADRYATAHKRENPDHEVSIRRYDQTSGPGQPKLLETVQIHRPVETVTDNGVRIPAIAHGHGRTALSVGHVRPRDFLPNAQSVFKSLEIDADGLLDEAEVQQRHALVSHRKHGAVTILWTVLNTGDRVTEDTPGAVPVTLIEI